MPNLKPRFVLELVLGYCNGLHILINGVQRTLFVQLGQNTHTVSPPTKCAIDINPASAAYQAAHCFLEENGYMSHSIA